MFTETMFKIVEYFLWECQALESNASSTISFVRHLVNQKEEENTLFWIQLLLVILLFNAGKHITS